jgi:uncharacterized membrane protein YphA (DoxX/SURF4 family)
MRESRLRTVLLRLALWVPTVLLGVFFVFVGIPKFLPDQPWARMFQDWGYPPGSHLLIGGLEVLGGVLLLVPRTTRYASYLLAMIMVGATVTHLIHGPLFNVAFTLGLAMVVLLLSRFHRPSRPKQASIAPRAPGVSTV